jgi:heterotetrameric sarcosine oxidase beta subunit
MMRPYSALKLIANAWSAHQHWPRAWRDPEPRSTYDIVIIGGGGHGLATAYYLARNHGLKNIAVLEKGYIGGGNTGRNTTIIRSDYYQEANSRFYEFSLKLWEGLSDELNFNIMVSQRGSLQLAHDEGQWNSLARLANRMQVNGIHAEMIGRKDLQEMIPVLDCSEQARFPVLGAMLQARGGTARHDAVAWGYARGADRLGVHIIQNCEVQGMDIRNNRVVGLQTSRGYVGAGTVGMAVAGHSSQVAAMAGLKLPIETHMLQAMVSEPVKPVLDTVVMAGALHAYVSQTDKGEIIMGSDLEFYPSYAQRGNLPRIEQIAQETLALFPSFSRLRLMRTWGGVNDMTMDGSPVIGATPVDGLFINGGWCYGGFKATPGSGWAFAQTLAQQQPAELIAPYSLERFYSGHTIDESGRGPVPQYQ